MTWYILTFGIGMIAGVLATVFVIPRVERFWNYVIKVRTKIKNVSW